MDKLIYKESFRILNRDKMPRLLRLRNQYKYASKLVFDCGVLVVH